MLSQTWPTLFNRLLLGGPSRKDIDLSPSGLPRRGSSLRKLKDFAFPFSKMQSSHVVSLSLRSGRLRYAPFHNARSLRVRSGFFSLECLNCPPCQELASRAFS